MLTNIIKATVMEVPWKKNRASVTCSASSLLSLTFLVLISACILPCNAQDYIEGDQLTKETTSATDSSGSDSSGDTPDPNEVALPPSMDDCNGIYLSYNFISREKEYPHVKNTTAQAWAFKSEITIMNTGSTEVQSWKVWVGFQHKELLVSTDGAVLSDGGDFPADVSNGTYLAGYPQTDLKTSIDTAGDWTQITVKVKITGTQFGVKPGQTPMPKTIRLENNGFKCPEPSKVGKSELRMCCKKDPKYKVKESKTTKYLARRNGDLSMVYDVLQTYGNNYMAQVTIDNNHPIGRLDHWNLTWEWMRGEFINSMKGAYTHKKDPSECIYGEQGKYYADMDFSNVQNCEKKPIISDLPSEMAKDNKVGNIPNCCRNGSIVPKILNETNARAIFQLQVYKIPPDLNRTAITPPQNWKINGVINPQYTCGAPLRIEPSVFPDPNGLQSTTSAIASWQIICNITRPKPQQSRCCVSFSAYYNDSVIPCNTCACGCPDTNKCNPDGRALLLPSESLLVPFANRTDKAKAWAKLKHFSVPKTLPCPDNCGVSINWHINSDYKSGWTARITIFNWGDQSFQDWFTAFEMSKAFPGYENVYSFNGTKVPNMNNTLLFHGLEGLNYLVALSNGSDPQRDPKVPGKQQSVVSFTKKQTPGIEVAKGDGFPARVYFNGEECALPTELPIGSGLKQSSVNLIGVIIVSIVTFVFMTDRFH